MLWITSTINHLPLHALQISIFFISLTSMWDKIKEYFLVWTLAGKHDSFAKKMYY